MHYQEKLIKVNLLSLRARRIQHQLITMFKMKKNLIDLQFEDFFLKKSYGKTRGNKYKLVVPKSKSSKHKNFFTNDCVRHWNRLKSSDIEVRTCGLFKKKIIEYVKTFGNALTLSTYMLINCPFPFSCINSFSKPCSDPCTIFHLRLLLCLSALPLGFFNKN